jgi:hypothetical protein
VTTVHLGRTFAGVLDFDAHLLAPARVFHRFVVVLDAGDDADVKELGRILSTERGK